MHEIRFASDIVLRPSQAQLLIGGRPAQLGGRAFEVLCALAERPGELITKRELMDRVWPDDEFAAQADALLDRLASGATKSYAGTKRQLNRWLYEQMDAQLEFEAQIQREMAASGDFAEGVAAFAAKRPPRFSGA